MPKGELEKRGINCPPTVECKKFVEYFELKTMQDVNSLKINRPKELKKETEKKEEDKDDEDTKSINEDSLTKANLDKLNKEYESKKPNKSVKSFYAKNITSEAELDLESEDNYASSVKSTTNNNEGNVTI